MKECCRPIIEKIGNISLINFLLNKKIFFVYQMNVLSRDIKCLSKDFCTDCISKTFLLHICIGTINVHFRYFAPLLNHHQGFYNC